MTEINLPKEWIDVQLGAFNEIQSGIGFPKAFQGRISGIYPVYKVGDVSRSVLNAKGKLSIAENYVDESDVKELRGFIFQEGTTLFAKIGEAVRLNRRAIVTKKGLADNNVMGVKPLFNEMDKFVHYFLKTVELGEASRSTTVPSIRKSDIEEIEIPFPPLSEQQQIAQKLDELLAQVDTLKTRLDAIPNILKRFRQSVLAAAVSGRLTEEWRGLNETPIKNNLLKEISEYWAVSYKIKNKKFKPPVIPALESPSEELPESWINTQIGYIFDVHVGATPSRAEESYWGGEVNWVSSSEVAFCRIKSTKDKITEEGLKSASTTVHPKGTVMLAMIGQGKTRGQVGILDIEACHNQNTAALRVPEDYASSMYLYFYLTKQYEETRRVGSGNNQQALNKATVQGLPFPLPPLEEQTEIVRRVEQLFAYADQIEQRVKDAQARVNHLTQSILAKAFRGELTADWRAQNPELISGENSAAALLERIKAEREAAAKPKRKVKA